MKSREGSRFPQPDVQAKAYFEALIVDLPGVAVRPMFGHLAAFVNGNMFSGFFGHDVFVRLGDEDRAELLSEPGATTFEPMKGRAMKEYVTLPSSWRGQPKRARPWVQSSLAWTAKLPAKRKTKAKGRTTTSTRKR